MEFVPALSREFRPYKPDPAPLLHICTAWDIPPSEVLMIGDSLRDDVSSSSIIFEVHSIDNSEKALYTDPLGLCFKVFSLAFFDLSPCLCGTVGVTNFYFLNFHSLTQANRGDLNQVLIYRNRCHIH